MVFLLSGEETPILRVFAVELALYALFPSIMRERLPFESRNFGKILRSRCRW